MMDDFEKSINASDLIDWIMCAIPDWCVGDVREIVDRIEEMPSAQPEITLESAIDYLHSIGWMQEHDKILTESAQPEQKKGKWIIKDNPGTGWYRVTCSECGEDVTSTIPMIGFFPNAKPLWDYCPDCGAKMEGHDE